MKKIMDKYKIQLKLLLPLTIGLIILSTFFYFLIPMVLNYPDDTYGTNFQIELENTNYLVQVLSISLSIFVIFVILTFYKARFLTKYSDLIDHPEKYTLKQINYVKTKLFTVPYSLFALDITIPSIALTVIHSFTIHQFGITTLKLFLLILSLMALYVTSVFIYTNNLFKKIALKLPYDNTEGIKKATLKKRVLYNIAPLLFGSMLFLALLGYTKVAIETGNSLFATYSKDLYYFSEYTTFNDLDDLLSKSKNLTFLNKSDYFFVRDLNGNFLDSDGNTIEFSNFFKKYLNDLSSKNNGRVYEYYGIDCQGATYNVNINNSQYTVGIYYSIISTDVLTYFSITFIFLIIINIVILTLFSNSLASDINTISENFMAIAKTSKMDSSNKLKLTSNKLKLTSNDEIGKLVISFNQIQELTKNNIQKIRDNQDTLMEKERLASLGQLIGGIAHNLKTPIMSISGAAEGLSDLVKEYDSSIDDPQVNSQDHHEIAKEMSTWIAKMREYTAYMSDIITAVKGQAVTLNNDEDVNFTISELLKRVDILMKHELKNALIYLRISLNVDENLTLDGDINSLVQVINNMISNSIQAYNGKTEQNIDLIVKKENQYLAIVIKDYGLGMSEKVRNKLFKEMVTTKGKNGTGLGLYMSYSTIRGHFNGDILVDSTEGEGTTFTILLPLK